MSGCKKTNKEMETVIIANSSQVTDVVYFVFESFVKVWNI